jgi:hypothetical protein
MDRSCHLTFVRSIVLVPWKGRLCRTKGCRWEPCFKTCERKIDCRIKGGIFRSAAEFVLGYGAYSLNNCRRALLAREGVKFKGDELMERGELELAKQKTNDAWHVGVEVTSSLS